MNCSRPLGFVVCAISLTAADSKVTFTEHIAPVLYAKCTSCHRPGEAAPFSLIEYNDAAKRAKLLAAVTQSRYMPPWKAEPASYGYRDSRRLTDSELALFQQWARDGAPQGNARKMPHLPKFPSGWQLGKPDLVVEIPEAFQVPAEGADLYRNVAIPLNLTEDKWIRAIEIRPSSRKVVHHVLYFADTSGEARKIAADTNGAMPFTRGTIGLGGWAVGGQPHLLPEGMATPLPKASDLVLQYHFHPTGKAEAEKSVIGFYFAAEAPKRTLTAIQLPPAFGLFAGIDIPPGKGDFTVRDSFVLPVDVDAISVGSHAHYLGKTMKMTATLPTGEVKTLLSIQDWDFAWQDRYFFEDFVGLPQGTRLDSEVTWDNSAANRHNPNPEPLRVQWGEQSADEMGAIGLQVVPRSEADLKTLQTAYRQHFRQEAVKRVMADPNFLNRVRKIFGGQLPPMPGVTDAAPKGSR